MRLTRFTTAIAAVALAGTLAGCGGDDNDSEEGVGAPSGGSSASTAPRPTFAAGTTMAKLQAADAVRLGTKFDQPGFGLKGLGDDPEGFDVEIAKIITEALGIDDDKITYTEAPSALREQLITDDKVDMVVATYTINDKRKERISFAGPYYEAGQDIMVKKDDTSITGPESLKADPSKKVCSVTGSTPAEEIRKYVTAAQLVEFDVYSKCADALRTGQVQAVTTDNVILLGFVADRPDDFKLVEKPFTQEPYGIGIKKGDTAFCTFIDETLKAAKADGRYDEAWKETAGEFSPNVPELPTADACS